MTPELWQRMEPLLHAALKKNSQDRAAFLERECGDDQELRMHLKRLIEAEEPVSTDRWTAGESQSLGGRAAPRHG
jgi:hypothetical protein